MWTVKFQSLGLTGSGSGRPLTSAPMQPPMSRPLGKSHAWPGTTALVRVCDNFLSQRATAGLPWARPVGVGRMRTARILRRRSGHGLTNCTGAMVIAPCNIPADARTGAASWCTTGDVRAAACALLTRTADRRAAISACTRIPRARRLYDGAIPWVWGKEL